MVATEAQEPVIPAASPTLTDEQIRERHRAQLLSVNFDTMECDACGTSGRLVGMVCYRRLRENSAYLERHPGLYCGKCPGPKDHV